MMRRRMLALAALVLIPLAVARSQTTVEERLRQHADSLARIRNERAQLEQQMRQMQGRARDITEEVSNLQRQTAATASLVRALDQQLEAINSEVNNSTASLVRAQDELAIKEADLHRRLTDIYRRGPLHTLEVLFSAHSFTDLVARYKYLHIQTKRDRAVVKRVKDLRDDIERTRAMRVRLQQDVGQTLAEKEREEERYRSLEQQRRQALTQVQQTTSQAQRRLAQIAEDEKRLNSLVESLGREARARGSGAGGVIPGASLFRAGAALDWPVQGELLYRFGPAPGPNNTTIRWNGIGISAIAGTAVRAVAIGRVSFIDSLGGYGRTILITHASGDFSIYGSLRSVSVQVGANVARGQQIGTVGVSESEPRPHLHFEVRLNSANEPKAVDPLPFLKPIR